MPESWVVIVDNSFYSQNQDYLPTRLHAQAEVARSLASRKLNDSAENKVGIFPLCMHNSQIITPTRSSSDINEYLTKLDLQYFTKCPVEHATLTFFEPFCRDSKILKTIVLMIGMKLNDTIAQKLLKSIQATLSKGVYIRVCFFGESVEYVPFFEDNISNPAFSYILADLGEDLYQAVFSVCDETPQDLEDNDPDYALAVQLSLEEANKNKK